MAIAIMVSTFGCNNGLILMGPRLYYAMAQDGLFFRAVGRLNRAGVPAAGLLLQALWSILLVFSGSYNQLLDYIIFAALLFYILTVLGVFVLRRTPAGAGSPLPRLRLSRGADPVHCSVRGHRTVAARGQAAVQLAQVPHRADRGACVFRLALVSSPAEASSPNSPSA